MNVTNVGLDQGLGTSGWRGSVHQAKQDFGLLVQALQNGNLAAAQQAYDAFQQIQPGPAAPSSSAGAAASPVAADWSALGSALNSGSLSSAQAALGKLQQDAAAAWQSHRQQDAANAQSVYALLDSVQGSATASGAVQKDLSSLSQALQAGDTGTAQKVLAQLEQDLKLSGQGGAGLHHHHHHGGFAANGAAAYSTTGAASTTGATTAGV